MSVDVGVYFSHFQSDCDVTDESHGLTKPTPKTTGPKGLNVLRLVATKERLYLRELR